MAQIGKVVMTMLIVFNAETICFIKKDTNKENFVTKYVWVNGFLRTWLKRNLLDGMVEKLFTVDM